MKTPPFLLKSVSLLGSALLRSWLGTLDAKAVYHDPVVDPAFANDGRRRIYVFWHEYLAIMLYLRRHCGITMLLSQHRDADVLEQVANMYGFGCVRGSTRRGGVAGLRQMMEIGADRNLTITPDGPRGPRRRFAQGAVYLASRLRFPIVLLGIGLEKPWRLNSWDRFALPRPYSRLRIVVSGDIEVPPDADRETIEHFRGKIEVLLNDLCDAGDRWAESDDLMHNQSRVFPGPNHSPFYLAQPFSPELRIAELYVNPLDVNQNVQT